MTAFALFITGLLLLLFGSRSVITNAIRISVLTKISPLIIGITLVAIGTSLPEMVVSVFGGLDKAEGLALGNIIGSNIANIGLILGISLLMRPLYIDQTNTQKNMLITLVVSLALFVTLLVDGITVLHGFIFIIIGCGVILWQILQGKSDAIEENLFRKDAYSPALTLFFFLISLLALFIGGKLLVDGGIAIATSLQVPQAIIGITAVSIGTSIPELAVSIAAFTKKATKHEEKLVIGNILGSNIFNILFGAGTLGLFGVKNFNSPLSLYAFFIFTLILGFLIYIFRGRTIPQYMGGGLVISYCLYLILLVLGSSILFQG